MRNRPNSGLNFIKSAPWSVGPHQSRTGQRKIVVIRSKHDPNLSLDNTGSDIILVQYPRQTPYSKITRSIPAPAPRTIFACPEWQTASLCRWRTGAFGIVNTHRCNRGFEFGILIHVVNNIPVAHLVWGHNADFLKIALIQGPAQPLDPGWIIGKAQVIAFIPGADKIDI